MDLALRRRVPRHTHFRSVSPAVRPRTRHPGGAHSSVFGRVHDVRDRRHVRRAVRVRECPRDDRHHEREPRTSPDADPQRSPVRNRLPVPGLAAGIWRRRPWPTRVGLTAAFLGALLVTIGLWVWANYRHAGSPFYSTNHEDLAVCCACPEPSARFLTSCSTI